VRSESGGRPDVGRGDPAQATASDFGTSGNLRKSDLVMWDRQTESCWQQATGTAIVGALTGTVLSVFPAAIISFDTFSQAYPRR
jgi:hypothetical protein